MSATITNRRLASNGTQLSAATDNATATRNADGTYTYTPASTDKPMKIAVINQDGDRVGKVELAVMQCAQPNLVSTVTMEQTVRLGSGVCGANLCWIASRIANKLVTYHCLIIPASMGAVTIRGIGYYSQSDYEHLTKLVAQGKLTIPWWRTPPTATEASPQPPMLVP